MNTTVDNLRNKFNQRETTARPGDVSEDRFTGAIEAQTAKLPSSTFLGIAGGCLAASLVLKLIGKDDWALFVGQWTAPLLILGSYNKMVKQHGSDANARMVA